MKEQIRLLVLMLLPLVASAHNIEVQNDDGVTIYYNYINNGTELEVTFRGSSSSSYHSEYTGNVAIPAEVTYMNRTRKVTSIGDHAFYCCSGLTSVTIPNSVVCIGGYAFYKCTGLTSVSIPNSVTNINYWTFSGCNKLTSITIGSSVRSIGYKAFENCSSLTKVIVCNLTAWCGISFEGLGNDDNPLSCAHHLYSDENTEIKNLVIPNGVTSIGESTFINCYSLTSVTIPNSVTSIGESAFSNCIGLTSVTIPNSVTSIGNGAFSGCKGFTSVTIPNSVTSIGNGAFSSCKGLTLITIPNSVTSIGNGSFKDCIGLTSVTIGNSVTSIGSEAFRNNSALTSVTIGNSVTSIGEYAFDGADIPIITSLIETPFAIKGKTSSGRVFTLNTYNNATLYVPKGTIDKYKTTDGWKGFVFIEESDTPPTPPTPKTCEKPTIIYRNGNLMFTSSTEGATCYYSIIDTDIKTGSGSEVQLTATYNISVYAAKEGFENSEIATATLCWIDDVPQMEGITNSLTRIAARPILVRTDNGFVTVEGIDDRTDVSVFAADGKLAGTAVSHSNIATIATSIQTGSIAIVKVGDRAIKVVME